MFYIKSSKTCVMRKKPTFVISTSIIRPFSVPLYLNLVSDVTQAYPERTSVTKNERITYYQKLCFSWEQTDGQKAQQSGQLRNDGQEHESLAVTGSFSWVAPDGVTYTVTYTAGKEGYKPKIQKSPEITPFEETEGISNRFSSVPIEALLG